MFYFIYLTIYYNLLIFIFYVITDYYTIDYILILLAALAYNNAYYSDNPYNNIEQ